MVENYQAGQFEVEVKRQEGVTPAAKLAELRPPKTTGSLWWRRPVEYPDIPTPDLHFEVITNAQISRDKQHFVCVGTDGSRQFLTRDDRVLLSGEFTELTPWSANWEDFSCMLVSSTDPQTGQSFHLINLYGQVRTVVFGKETVKVDYLSFDQQRFVFISQDETGKNLHLISGEGITTPFTGAKEINVLEIVDGASKFIVSTTDQNNSHSLHLITIEGQVFTIMEKADQIELFHLDNKNRIVRTHPIGEKPHLVIGRYGNSAVFAVFNPTNPDIEDSLVNKREETVPPNTETVRVIGLSEYASTFFWRTKNADGSYDYFINDKKLAHSPKGGLDFKTTDDLSNIWLISPADAPKAVVNFNGRNLLKDIEPTTNILCVNHYIINEEQTWMIAKLTLASKEPGKPWWILVANPDGQQILGPFDGIMSIGLDSQIAHPSANAVIDRGNVEYLLTITPGTNDESTTVEETPVPAAA